MSAKPARIAALLDELRPAPPPGTDPRFAAYFTLFNAGRYYDAHDALEALWLPVRRGPEGAYFKGLIQLAGAFVHLQKARTGPAAALFRLADANLARFPSRPHGLDTAAVRGLIAGSLARLAAGAAPAHLLEPPPRLNFDA
jgi:predicted metal-dependent hydrolase